MKKVITWVVLTLILEISGLFVLNNFIFVTSTDFESNQVKIEQDTSKEISTFIEEGASDVRLSYNGKYLTYYTGDKLNIQDTETGKVNEIETDDDEVVMCSRWLDKRNLIAVVEKVKKDGKQKLQLITYNPTDSSKSFVQEICNYEKNMKVENMVTAVLTNVYYIQVNKGDSKNVVYRIDRNNELTQVKIKADELGNMQTLPHEDRLIYEDKSNNKFFITSPDKELVFDTNKNMELLGIDREDTVYLGELNGEKIESIAYGKISGDTPNWKEIKLNFPVNKEDLFFNEKSQIVVNDSLKGSVKNMTTGVEMEYEGDLIEIKEDFIAVMDSKRKLVYKKLNDN